MLPPTPADFIGAGPFWSGEAAPDAPTAVPGLFPRGAAMGQHLSVERLVRIAEQRLFYLVNNLSRKWSRRMCWACGNKYSPDSAKCCSYCGQPLSDQRFLMSARWNRASFDGFEALTRLRVRHFGLISPVYAFYRNNLLMSVYPYDGGALLVDFTAPLSGLQLLRMAVQLSETIAHLHEHGVVLSALRPANVLIMPDGTPRLFDLDVEEVLPVPQNLYRDARQPALRDTRALGQLLLPLASLEDAPLSNLLKKASDGMFPGPIPFMQVARRLLAEVSAHEPPPPTRVAAYSDLGLYRAANEDAWGWRRLGPSAAIYAVADGMGGHAHGRDASDLTLSTFLQAVAESVALDKPDPKQAQETLIAAVRRANDTVYRARKARNIEMGATLTAALVIGHDLFIAHVGDSSAWYLHKAALRRLTAEHTVAAELLADKSITPEQFATHRARHVLTNAIGMEPKLEEIDVLHQKAAAGDRLLLCSDGLTNEVSPEALQHSLHAWADRHKAVRELVREAYASGGHDNVTALLVDLG